MLWMEHASGARISLNRARPKALQRARLPTKPDDGMYSGGRKNPSILRARRGNLINEKAA
jgi:hypothetical protein